MSTSRRILPVVFFLLLTFACPFFYGACRKAAPPEPYVGSIELTAEDASCTEAWLRVRFTDSSTPRSFRIVRDSQTVLMALNAPLDTLVVDTALSPNRRYTYKAYRLTDNRATDSTDQLSITTMDSTSHNFTWQTFLLGDSSGECNGSSLYDVAIISDTLVYVVGEIYIKDSLGNCDPLPYNLAKWDGQQWELMRRLYDCRLYFPNCGPSYFLYTPIRSIFAFGPNDIWIAAGTAQHYDGVQWTEHAGIEGVGGAYEIWGSSSNELYFVGYGGFIARKSGGTWQRLESGRTFDVVDAWGVMNPVTGKIEVYCPESAPFTPADGRILRISDHTMVDTLSWEPGRRLSAVWTHRGHPLFTAGDGVFENSRGHWREVNVGATISTNDIRGTSLNNIFVVGGFGLVAHFNGVDWHIYPELFDGGYVSVAIQGDMVVEVGTRNDRGKVTIGRRN